MKGRNITIKLLLLALTMLSSNLWAQVTAQFTSNITSGCSLPTQVQFTDQSTTVGGTINLRNWSFGNGSTSTAANPTVNYNQPGIYTVTLIVRNTLNQRDTIVKTAYVTISGTVSIASTVTNATCYNCPDGEIALNVNGGTPPYSYLWSNGSTAPTAIGLVPALYNVTVADANGCSRILGGTWVRVICMPITVEVVLDPAPSCYGTNDGILRGSLISGGRGPVGYSWFDPYYVDPCAGSGVPCPPGPPPPDTLAGVGAGTYIFFVIDQDQCIGADTIVVTEPMPLTISEAITGTSCPACTDGVIDINVTGGSGSYTYLWSTAATTSSLQNLPSGTYSVTVTDVNGCSATATYTVSGICNFPITTITTTDITCFGTATGTATFSSTGGTAPYTYRLITGPTTSPATGLSTGNYTLITTDATGCFLTDYFIILQPTQIIITGAITNASCPTCADGAVDINVTGGVPPYNYMWSNNAITNSIQSQVPATYTLTVTDGSGCTATGTYVVGLSCAHVTTITTTDVTCFGGSNGTATFAATGGTAPYTYLLNGGSTPSPATNLSHGLYTLTTTDATGCFVVDVITILQPSEIFIIETITDATCPTCADGLIDINVTGGVGNYTYLWSTGATTISIQNLLPATYTVTVTDGNGCTKSKSKTIADSICVLFNNLSVNAVSCFSGQDGSISVDSTRYGIAPYTYQWSNGQSGVNNTNLASGIYSLTATDSRGCTGTATVTVPEPSALQINEATTNTSCLTCADGVIDISVTGGTPTYNYEWSTGATTTAITGLLPGNYTVTVNDGNGCTISETFVLDTLCNHSFSSQITPVHCWQSDMGAINIVPGGTNQPWTFAWSTGSTSASINTLTYGNYSLTITDATGCTDIHQLEVPITDTLNIVTNLVTDVSCVACNDGTIDITVVGGEAPYTYNWSNGAVTEDLSNLTASAYTLTVTDATGCQKVEWLWVRNTCSMQGSLEDSVDCSASVIIRPNVAGGTWPFTYLWSTGANTSSISVTSLGTYHLTITDANSCAWVDSFQVTSLTYTDCVWPGDADNSGLVDNDDVLAIGIGYGDTGPVRSNASLGWTGQAGIDWTSSLAGGSNYKHIDTNGDGDIDSDDTLAITINYGLTHLKADEDRETNMPSIYIVLPDSVSAGQTVQGQIYLGSDSFPLSNIYGIKFSMTYNSDFVEEGTVGFNFAPSWMGTPGTDVLTFQKDLYTSNRIDGALTGINHVNRNGFGAIGAANFTMKDDISGKDLYATPMIISFSNVRAISATESEVDVAGSETTTIATQLVGIGTLNNTLAVSIYPNPAAGILYINTFNQPVQNIAIHNTLGMGLDVPITKQGNIYQLETSHLPSGVYMVTIQSGNSITTQRVVLSK
ncbi:hypothetical protein BH09BAC1_BH09BAC1_05900 [soil metagenome]